MEKKLYDSLSFFILSSIFIPSTICCAENPPTSFIESKEYGLTVEKYFREIMSDLYKSKDYKKEYSPSELLYEFGKRMKDNNSIIRQAYLNNVKLYFFNSSRKKLFFAVFFFHIIT